MSVIKSMMVRIGADASGMRSEMQKASKNLQDFSKSTNRSMNNIKGRNGLGGLNNVGRDVNASMSRLSGSKGLGSVGKSLGGLSRLMAGSTAGLAELGAAALGASSALGPVGLAIGVVTAAVGLAVVGIGKASQTAVKFQADLGRVNMALGESTSKYMAWAKSQGLARSTSAELGATYGILLSSFIKGNGELGKSTQDIVQATRVVASATGRTIDDTFERMRSGLLGNTEAVEDLGIFVNVSMIESTNAFKKFANGKHWDQLDFRIQSQIRLQAILEQAQARYGSSLQNNVMTKQMALSEQLKEIKLNLSQAFLPIWEAILPALSKFAGALVVVTENLARFSYWLTGKNYDEATKGTDKQTTAVKDLGDSYKDAGEKAKGSLAAFDEINQLGDFSGSGGSGGAGSGTGSGGPGTGNNGKGTGNAFNMPSLPPLPHLRLEFDPPEPPDAGMGAVATAVVSTVNEMNAKIKTAMQTMWEQINAQATAGVQTQVGTWGGFAEAVGAVIVPGLVGGVIGQWTSMWSQMTQQTATGRASIENAWNGLLATLSTGITLVRSQIPSAWQATLADMLQQLNAYRPLFESDWESLKIELESIKTPLASVQTAWHETLDYMQSQLNAYNPYLTNGWNTLIQTLEGLIPSSLLVPIVWHNMLEQMQSSLNKYQPPIEYGISLIGTSLSALVEGLKSTVSAFQIGWDAIFNAVNTATAPIVNLIKGLEDAYASLMAALGEPISIPKFELPHIEMPKIATNIADIFKGIGSGYVDAMDALSRTSFMKWVAAHPELGSGVGAGGAVSGAIGGLEAGGASLLSKIKALFDSLRGGIGGAVPALAAGGITNGPMLAMIGDNVGGQEVVSPLDDLKDIIQSVVATAVATATQFNSGNKGDVNIIIDGVQLARAIQPYTSRESSRIGGSMITTT